MKAVAILALAVAVLYGSPARAMPANGVLGPQLQATVDAYLRKRAGPEHISAVSLSVSFPARTENLNVVTGRTSRGPGGVPITPESLFQIGSITKSFTAATILQLEAEGALSIDQTIGYWLPEYPAWRDLSIRRLLNMTSGIFGYDNVPAMMQQEVKTIHRRWTPPVLVGMVDPAYGHAPPPTTGWSYSNTNYLLAGMIIERVTGNSYGSEIERRFFGPKLGLQETYYSPNVYSAAILDRLVSGYYFNPDPKLTWLQPLVGVDVRTGDMSWAGAAGGIVARLEDVTHWVRALYQGEILPPQQRRELLSIVSMRSGKPIARTSAGDPRGFGLGVGQAVRPGNGMFWFYQGETLGYRVLYGWFPKDDLVIAVATNSQPPERENHLGALMEQVHALVVKTPEVLGTVTTRTRNR
jgi:D-alanyl-D-alanine carboxypeptidase